MQLPFVHLNLRKNPFGEPPAHERSALAIVPQLDEFLRFLERGSCVLEFIGHQGRGKSTHMRALHARFPHAPYLYFSQDDPHPPIPWEQPVLFLDETQRLSFFARRRLWRSKKTLIIATHAEHSKAIRRAGMRCEVVRLEGLTRQKLRAVLEQRLEWATRSPEAPIPWFEDEDLDALIAHFGDDLHAIERHLYDVFQLMKTPERARIIF